MFTGYHFRIMFVVAVVVVLVSVLQLMGLIQVPERITTVLTALCYFGSVVFGGITFLALQEYNTNDEMVSYFGKEPIHCLYSMIWIVAFIPALIADLQYLYIATGVTFVVLELVRMIHKTCISED